MNISWQFDNKDVWKFSEPEIAQGIPNLAGRKIAKR